MPATHNPTGSILALDVGAKRVGVARASLVARLPEPLVTVRRGPDFLKDLQEIVKKENAGAIVIGLPRGLNGQSTAQTKATEVFIADIQSQIEMPIYIQDEALTSRQAETELGSRKDAAYKREEVDALAATYILEDFLAEHSSELAGLTA